MSVITLQARAQTGSRRDPADHTTADPPARRLTPVKWWAGAGVLFLSLIAYLLIAWLASGDAKPTPPGPTPVPSSMHTVLVIGQIVMPLAAVAMMMRVVLVPWLRTRRFSFDALFVVALLTIIWQDTLSCYAVAYGTYNADLVNFGNWSTQIPGWLSPRAHLIAEPTLFLLLYIVTMYPAAVIGSATMRAIKRRYPRVGPVGLVLPTFLLMCLGDALSEGLWLRLGFYDYAGDWGPKLFPSHFYRFPLVEALCLGAFLTFLSILRYHLDAHGRSFAERGLDRTRAVQWQRTALRFLALVGVLNLAYLGFYNLPKQWSAMHSPGFPKDMLSRSYLLDGICGPGTRYACAHAGTPVSRAELAHGGRPHSLPLASPDVAHQKGSTR
jgi:hypothetical protein